MARILMVLLAVAAGASALAAVLAHGSQAAPRAGVVLPPVGPTPEAGPAALPQAAAAIQRTFVSTSGNDANACTRAEPCRGFAAAIANTLAGGEVVALDSGGYGPFTVNKAITIAGAPGAHVAVSVFSGNGIGITTASSDTVVLKNLYLTGLGGVAGIAFFGSGTLYVENVVASGFGWYGLYASADEGSVFVRDSVFRHSGDFGAHVDGGLTFEIADSRAEGNGGFGFHLAGHVRGSIVRSAASGNLAGFVFEGGPQAALSDCAADDNGAAGGVWVAGAGSNVTLRAATLSNNGGAGLIVQDEGLARISGSTVTGNATGLLQFQMFGTLETFSDNLVRGNTTNTSGTITTVSKT